MKKKAKSSAVQLAVPWVEFIHYTNDRGTYIWLLPENMSKEFRELPEEVQEHHKSVAMQVIVEAGLFSLAFLKHPESEQALRMLVHEAFNKLRERIAELIENPPKPQ